MSGAFALSEYPTVELIARAKSGDREAVDAIFERAVPPVRRWAHGRVPPTLRSQLDTDDLVQQAVMRTIPRLAHFEARDVGAMQAYLRQSVINEIRTVLRKVRRVQELGDLAEKTESNEDSPLEVAIGNETYDDYRVALGALRTSDRDLVLARVEAHWTNEDIAEHFGYRTVNAARVAVIRALNRLRQALDERQSGRSEHHD